VYYSQQTMQYLREVTMETLLMIIGIAAVALFLFRPSPGQCIKTGIVYANESA
jgi:hypothetical protein